MYKLPNGKKIDEVACLIAINDNGGKIRYWLDARSGEVIRLAEFNDQIDFKKMSEKYESSQRYFSIPHLDTREKYEIRAGFVEFVALEDRILAEKLAIAINGKRAFRRFKDVLHASAKEWVDSWHEWERQSLYEYLDYWLKELPIDIDDGWQEFFEENCGCPICKAMAEGRTDEQSIKDAFREANFKQIIGDITDKK